jgi:hypothetical protein
VLEPELLQDFICGFYGYGNLGAKYWFIGLEEGGGTSIDEIQHRLEPNAILESNFFEWRESDW